MKKILFIANWKMQPESSREARALWSTTRRTARNAKKTVVAVCPPFVHIQLCAQTNDRTVRLGAQDVSIYTDGAHTGEISGAMLKELRVQYVIVGHSERRALGETNRIVAQKIKNTLTSGMRPILCVGEHEREHHGEHLVFLQEQITQSLAGVGKAKAKNLMIAYEPLWAIGKSFKYAMHPSDIHETALFIRKILTKLFGRAVGTAIPVLYGGSVETGNIADVVTDGEVDGVLVGHASLNPQQVTGMIRALELRT